MSSNSRLPSPVSHRGSRRIGLPAKLLLAAISMVATALALEIGARVLNLSTGFFLLARGGNCLQRSGTLSMEFRPHCIGELHFTPVGTNALGFRGPELRDGPLRILALGDSCTWGWRVGQNESYPAVLQQVLDQQYGDGRYQVINAGVPGYTSYQTLVALQEKGLPLKPDIVIIAVGFNDLFKTGDVERQIASERRFMPLLKLDDLLLDTSRMYRWVRWQAAAATNEQAVRVTPEGYQRNMRAMVEMARAQGAHVLLLSFWHPLTNDQPYRLAMISAAESEKAPLVTYDGPLIDVVHPTPEGYAILVRAIVDALRAEGWLPIPSPARERAG
jgi:lysophospholipase L1-like esterase